MIQTLLMFLAPAQDPATSPPERGPATRMATRTPATSLVHKRSWKLRFASWGAIFGNAAGFILFLSSLWLVLRLAEVLLY